MMQGTWEDGKFVLASTTNDKIKQRDAQIANLQLENKTLREALDEIKSASVSSDDGYLLQEFATNALSTPTSKANDLVP